jgi:hypothetical protein
MKKRIIRAIKKNSKVCVVSTLFLLYLFFAFYILKNEEVKLTMVVGYNPVLDLKFYYSSDYVWRTLELLGEDLRNEYAFFELVVDPLYTIIYSLFFSFLIAYCTRKLKLKGIWNDLILLPFITAFLDLIENSMILSMILAYPSVLIGFSVLGSLFTILKLSSFILIVGLSLFLLVFTVIKKVRKATVSRLIKKASV